MYENIIFLSSLFHLLGSTVALHVIIKVKHMELTMHAQGMHSYACFYAINSVRNHCDPKFQLREQ